MAGRPGVGVPGVPTAWLCQAPPARSTHSPAHTLVPPRPVTGPGPNSVCGALLLRRSPHLTGSVTRVPPAGWLSSALLGLRSGSVTSCLFRSRPWPAFCHVPPACARSGLASPCFPRTSAPSLLLPLSGQHPVPRGPDPLGGSHSRLVLRWVLGVARQTVSFL